MHDCCCCVAKPVWQLKRSTLCGNGTLWIFAAPGSQDSAAVYLCWECRAPFLLQSQVIGGCTNVPPDSAKGLHRECRGSRDPSGVEQRCLLPSRRAGGALCELSSVYTITDYQRCVDLWGGHTRRGFRNPGRVQFRPPRPRCGIFRFDVLNSLLGRGTATLRRLACLHNVPSPLLSAADADDDGFGS